MSIDLDSIRTVQQTYTLAERRQQLATAQARHDALRLRYPDECAKLRLGHSIGADAIRRIALSLGAPPEIAEGYTDPATEWILNRLRETASDRINAAADLRMAQDAARPTTEDYAVMAWESIPADRRYVGESGDTAGKRFVFGWVEGAGTCLVPWTGPKEA